ncbi:DUF3099 domain-containing protein [Microbacterium sp. STN6]|uniref:DUF3099 domain-containing protein n=1 Tax=Microbacterium sp. STN6 TaxID=2995588 RepID=UPI002260B67B|nr:DUF3099 domain-containing protein [Microbacterium sp. STN6]MCX7521610.1 DUF3099 domain-containing protein [Microbacterium sp. STN6]
MKQQSITSLPLAPEVERHRRMLKYSIAMGIRIPCIISLLFLHGWWLLIPALGAVFLPYFAVVLANAVRQDTMPAVERPGNVERVGRPETGEQGAGGHTADGHTAGENTARENTAGENTAGGHTAGDPAEGGGAR